jgi:HPt (histidine-containing phosphotransfer) domain-containing protein
MSKEYFSVAAASAVVDLNTNDGVDLFRRLVADFATESEELCANLKTSWARQDLRAAERAAHTIKGSAALVGAALMGRLAEDVLAAIQADPPPDLTARVRSLLDAREPTLRAMNEFLKVRPG